MKSRVFCSFFFAYLLLFVHVDSIRIKNSDHLHLVSLEKVETLQTNNDNGDSAIAAAQACYAGFVENIPPSFCYKKGADAGVIPTGCPDDYFRSAALCYKYCKSGYVHVLGVCWEKCRSGYTDMGLTCFKWDWFKSKSYGKDSYIPSSITNFDSRIPCPDGMYRSGALCYRDCSNIGLSNCGIGACAANDQVCAISLTTMATNLAISMAQAVAFVGSFGTSSAATPGVQAGRTAVSKSFQSLSKTALKSAAKNALTSIKRMTTKEFFKKMTTSAVKKAGSLVATTVIQKACEEVGNKILAKLEANQNNEPALEWQDFDITGVSTAVEDCKDQTNENNRIRCAQAVLNTVSIADPTGVVGMATSFMSNTCNV